ncbi:uncharacterized protein LOC118205036 [Stegodyphus dumicola]|uniref:uncharacterized protein LOC118205036 n=1 Tax=Stegodyphus dumicola TaxID=202533 RepID=UPI0015AC91ED|nr:uncharacterized protein LOC118205036 [Stegodyphus dumicola]
MIAWIFRFIHNLKNEDKNLTSDVSVDELENAEKALCRLVQKESFTGIKDRAIRALRPIVDRNGILSAQTNVLQRQDNENFRYPIILPSKHLLVERLIYEEHLEIQHAGVSTLMTNLRENFWILKSRKSIRNIYQKMVRCKDLFVTQRVEVKSGFPPEDRVREGATFEVVGVDLASPLYVREGSKGPSTRSNFLSQLSWPTISEIARLSTRNDFLVSTGIHLAIHCERKCSRPLQRHTVYDL